VEHETRAGRNASIFPTYDAAQQLAHRWPGYAGPAAEPRSVSHVTGLYGVLTSSERCGSAAGRRSRAIGWANCWAAS